MRTLTLLLFFGLSGLTACAHHASGSGVVGPKREAFPIYRPYPGADKIFVLADPGDGEEHVFLVDTGASVSVITPELAIRLGLSITDDGDELIGLGGRTAWRRATLRSLKLGRTRIPNVEVAVGVAGVPTSAGLVPVDGLLGNNVWSHFQVVVDYHANHMELGQPGTIEVPVSAVPMVFNGQHISTSATLVVKTEGEPLRHAATLEVDTGARGVVLSGVAGRGLEGHGTEGEELILGVGAPDEVPTANFSRTTRHVPLSAVEIGGTTVTRDLQATWINYDDRDRRVGPPEMRGLLGSEVLEDQRVLFDYPGGRFAITPSDRPADNHDLHERLERSLRREKDPQLRLQRALALAMLEREDEAQKVLDAMLDDNPKDSKALVLRARMWRAGGRADDALKLLTEMSTEELVDQGEIIATVNGLWLTGESERGLALARQATEKRPEASEAWVALADALRTSGDGPGAAAAIQRVNQLDELPDGHLVRRAWLSAAEADLLGAVSHTHRLIEAAPGWGAGLWMFATAVVGTDEVALCRYDIARALGRLHPEDRPYDFAAAASRLLGDLPNARTLAAAGQARDCPQASNAASKANCEAWYLAMAGDDLGRAQARIAEALAAEPARAEYLDTQATILEQQGDLAGARDAAFRAAAQNPEDVYLLWQAARLDAATRGGTRK